MLPGLKVEAWDMGGMGGKGRRLFCCLVLACGGVWVGERAYGGMGT